MRIAFQLSGLSAFLMHRDDIEAGDIVRKWQKDPKNKNISVKGDDRSPAWTWRTYLYHDGSNLVIPFENMMSCLKAAGNKMQIKGNKTYKESTQAGIGILTEFLDFRCNDKQIPIAPLIELSQEEDFDVQANKVRDFGFRLFLKRAKVGQSKWVRVRPRFDNWSVRGELITTVPELTFPVMEELFELAGRVGLGDWRPGSPKSPGPFGMFKATILQMNN